MLWDFDGTLAQRPGLWSACLVEVLDDLLPGHGVTIDALKPGLRDGFPWHRPETPHLELAAADDWWNSLTPMLTEAYLGVGLDLHAAATAAARVRTRYYDPKAWSIIDGAIEALAALRLDGWSNVILSNHGPELPTLVQQLGLGELIKTTFTSAALGYEKPNPQAFRAAIVALNEPTGVWMIGDNPVADVAGALAVGIPAILVDAIYPDSQGSTLAEAVARIRASG